MTFYRIMSIAWLVLALGHILRGNDPAYIMGSLIVCLLSFATADIIAAIERKP